MLFSRQIVMLGHAIHQRVLLHFVTLSDLSKGLFSLCVTVDGFFATITDRDWMAIPASLIEI